MTDYKQKMLDECKEMEEYDAKYNEWSNSVVNAIKALDFPLAGNESKRVKAYKMQKSKRLTKAIAKFIETISKTDGEDKAE